MPICAAPVRPEEGSMIQQSCRDDAIAVAREAYGLGAGSAIDDAYLASALRRAAGHLCPCSPRTLVSAIAELHRGLAQDDAFEAQVEDILDSLVAHGDLLELSAVTTLTARVKLRRESVWARVCK